ncbi:DUF5676 family membrane protein [Lutibacter sp.]|uniref:DUF5676 family membrane protein n=1 Tax=Lutibacter sp. TaxID=1925666 RepID=UPI0025BBF589|nr:DUF5676 family membrane protein [Lutibacter sp.]MCF6166969.1 DUF5676 family membrane protein [Lutibacter sp.]
MTQINAKKFSLASGITGVIIYISCFFLMSILDKSTLIRLANTLFHGMDFSNILRMDIPIIETAIGIILSFIFWGITGYILAFVYNKIK